MPKIEYDIIINSEGALLGIKDLNTGQQVLFDNMKKNAVESKKVIDDLNASIDVEKQKIKELTKAWQEGQLTYGQYADKVGEANQKITDFADAGAAVVQTQTKLSAATAKVGKAFTALRSIFMKFTIVLAVVTTAFKILQKLFFSGQGFIDKMKVSVAGVKGAFEGFWDSLGKEKYLTGTIRNMKEAAKAARELKQAQIDLIKIQNQTALLVSRLTSAMIDYEAVMNDESKTVQERTAAANDYFAAEFKILELKQKEARAIYDIAIAQLMRETDLTKDQVLALVALGTEVDKNNKFYKEWKDISSEALTAFVQAEIAYERAGDELATFQQDLTKKLSDIFKDYNKAIEKDEQERLKKQEEFQEASLKLAEEYAKSFVEAASGKDKIIMERNFRLAEIDALQKHLESLGTLTKEQYDQIAILRQNAYDKAELALIDYDIAYQKEQEKSHKAVLDKEEEHAEQMLNLERQTQEEALNLLENNEKAKLDLQIKFAEEEYNKLKEKILSGKGTDEDQALLNLIFTQLQVLRKNKKKLEDEANKFNIFKLIGIDDPEQQQKAKQNLQTMFDNITGTLDQIFEQRVNDAERKRSLLDDEISMTQEALEAEMELMQAGYANNVEAKRKELEALKKEREKALKEEEKAIKAQKALDTTMQISSLITASAQILKGTAKDPITLGIAIAAIAAMFGAFAAAKAQAAKATKLAKGGVGTVDGKSHAEGGEPFLDHVEVERGEMWGVLSRKATHKYGKAFGQIVNSFNRDKLPIGAAVSDNNIYVDVNQTNERLDKVEFQLIKLNRHFAGKKEIHDLGSMRVEKIGNKTRIIRKA